MGLAFFSFLLGCDATPKTGSTQSFFFSFPLRRETNPVEPVPPRHVRTDFAQLDAQHSSGNDHPLCKYSQWHMGVRHDSEHVRTERKTSRLQPTHTRVGSLSQGHPGLCGTPVCPGKDAHGTRGPVRRKGVARQLHDETTDRQGLETNVLSVNKFRLTQQPSADRHLDTYTLSQGMLRVSSPPGSSGPGDPEGGPALFPRVEPAPLGICFFFFWPTRRIDLCPEGVSASTAHGRKVGVQPGPGHQLSEIPSEPGTPFAPVQCFERQKLFLGKCILGNDWLVYKHQSTALCSNTVGLWIGRPVVFAQHTDRFIVENDKMNSYTRIRNVVKITVNLAQGE